MNSTATILALATLLGCAQAFDLSNLLPRSASNLLVLPSIEKLEDKALTQMGLGDDLENDNFNVMMLADARETDSETPKATNDSRTSDLEADSEPTGLFDIAPSACGQVFFGWEMHDDRLPEGKWEPYEALSAEDCVLACAGRPDRCVAAMWTHSDIPVPSAYADNSRCELVTGLTGLTRSDIPDGVDFFTPCHTGCDKEHRGYQRYSATLPNGVWESYYADSPSECAIACTTNLNGCVAALWEDASILPYGEASRCQLVSLLTGYIRDMPQGADLYAKC